MGFKLTKQQAREWVSHEQNVRDNHKRLSDAIHSFNAALNQGRNAIETFVASYNDAVNEAKEFINSLGSEWRAEFDERSESWQEGDTGQEVSGVIEGMENYAPEEFTLNTVDSMEEPDVNEADEMEGVKPEE